MSNEARVEFLLRLGDSALILGQRLSAWCGHGPALEEDIAMTNVALDLIGHARYWLDYAGELEGIGRDSDTLAFFRDADEFHNIVLVEQPNGHFGDTLMRQFFFDSWYYLVLAELVHSTDKRVSEIAAKTVKEVRYHLQRSSDWVIRLGDGTDESRKRMQASANRLWTFVGELFRHSDVESKALEQGRAVDLVQLRSAWQKNLEVVFADATLTVPEGPTQRVGMAAGEHTEHLSYLVGEMQTLRRAYPGAQW